MTCTLTAKKFIAVTAGLLFLTGCSSMDFSSDTYNNDDAFEATEVYPGEILSVTTVKVHPGGEGGALTGLLLGAVAGSAGAANSYNREGGAIIGGLVGSVLGKTLDSSRQIPAKRYIIKRLDTQKLLTVIEAPDAPFRVGDKVFLMEGNMRDSEGKIIKRVRLQLQDSDTSAPAANKEAPVAP